MLEYWPQVQRSVIPPCALHCRTSVTDRINLKQANGFYRSKGVSGRIPEGYTLLEQRFWRGIIRSNRVWSGQHCVQLHEWVRDGWTYHAKGIWVTPTGDSTSDESGNYPVMTLFGSTNLNSRSANLDTELQLCDAGDGGRSVERLAPKTAWCQERQTGNMGWPSLALSHLAGLCCESR